MATVYSGWFDTLALVPSRSERKLLIYDLDRLANGGEVSLRGTPGPGAVTPEGTKLYLALEGTHQVAVIDLQMLATQNTNGLSGGINMRSSVRLPRIVTAAFIASCLSPLLTRTGVGAGHLDNAARNQARGVA